MLQNKSYKIKSCDDSELKLPRSSEKNPKLEFKLCWEDSKPVSFILVLNQGLGDDINNNYFKLVMESLAKKHHAAVLSANYHNIGNRPQTGAKMDFDDFDKNIFEHLCKNKIDLPQDFRTSEFAFNANFMLQDYIEVGKRQGAIPSDFKLAVSATLFPARGEYQNFGVMPALDILNALFFVQKNPPFKIEGGGGAKSLPVIIAGGSYGGYLASMCAKIAPWAIDGVIDNSGGAKFVERMLGFGKEIGYKEHCSVVLPSEHLVLCFCDKTFWTSKKSSRYFFSPARRKIRYILEPRHLEIQAAYPKPIYVSYHSAKDHQLPLKEKIELYKIYQKLGFDATLHAVRYKKQIDGKFIKTLDHGLGIPFKALINKHLLEILEKLSLRYAPANSASTPLLIPRTKNKSIAYPCDDLLYTFSEKNHKIELEISKCKKC